jgi:hypothetical protein
MKKRIMFFTVLLGIMIVALFTMGCTTVSSASETNLVFQEQMPPENMVIGSFTYELALYTSGGKQASYWAPKETYLIAPDGSVVLDQTLRDVESEAYHIEKYTDSEGNPRSRKVLNEGYFEIEFVDMKGARKKYVTNVEGYRIATSDEVFLYAHRVAAEKTGITHIIASTAALITKQTSFFGAPLGLPSIYRHITVYGVPTPPISSLRVE